MSSDLNGHVDADSKLLSLLILPIVFLLFPLSAGNRPPKPSDCSLYVYWRLESRTGSC